MPCMRELFSQVFEILNSYNLIDFYTYIYVFMCIIDTIFTMRFSFFTFRSSLFDLQSLLFTGGLNKLRGGSRDVFLTLIGGGVFNNDLVWIGDAIVRAIVCAYRLNLDINVVVCFYRNIDNGLVAHMRAKLRAELSRFGYDVSHL